MQRHVFIATPTHSGQVCVEYTKSLVETLPVLWNARVRYTHTFVIGNPLVHDARNRLVAWFLADQDATDLFFIDADIGWEPQDFLRLAQSPHDVIGGAYRQKRDDKEYYNAAGLETGPTRLIKVDYLGAGFLKISRKAILKLIEAHPDKQYESLDGVPCYGLFEVPIGDGRIIGEDALFCRRWKALGGKVFLDPDMTLLHVGQKAWRGNFSELIARAGHDDSERCGGASSEAQPDT